MGEVEKRKERDKVWDKVKKRRRRKCGKGDEEEVGVRSQSHFHHRNLLC